MFDAPSINEQLVIEAIIWKRGQEARGQYEKLRQEAPQDAASLGTNWLARQMEVIDKEVRARWKRDPHFREQETQKYAAERADSQHRREIAGFANRIIANLEKQRLNEI